MLNTGNNSGFYQLPSAIREEALEAHLQASSRSKRDLLRKRGNDGVYEKSPAFDRAF